MRPALISGTHSMELCRAVGAPQEPSMLVITRKAGESLELSGPARVVVLDVQRGRIKVGIIAPRTTEVWRSEIAAKGVRRLPLVRR